MNVRFLEPNIVNMTAYHTDHVATVDPVVAKKLVKEKKAVFTHAKPTAPPSHPEDLVKAEDVEDDEDDDLSQDEISARLRALALRGRKPNGDEVIGPDSDPSEWNGTEGAPEPPLDDEPDGEPHPAAVPAKPRGKKV